MANKPSNATALARAAHVVADQDEVFGFLAAPEAHGGKAVSRVDTHGAVVFLAGDHAYKVKRAVKFPFMDFSTLEKRRTACEAELRINRLNAPDIYIDAIPIVRQRGALRLGGPGEVVEWAVRMRRFDERRTLDRVAERDGLTMSLIERMADAIVVAQRRAPPCPDVDAVGALGAVIEGNARELGESPDLFAPDRAAELTRRSRERLWALAPLLAERARAGLVRRCHGDLHLRNMVMLGDMPCLFDALEFDESLAMIDVLYDTAFLLMDLLNRDLVREASYLFNRYLQAWADTRQLKGLAALPLFISVRASIRAKVIAAGLAHLAAIEQADAAAAARGYFALALTALDPAAPRLVAIGGLSGTGKSTLAAALAAGLGHLPGAVHLRSDVVRKQILGVAEFERLPPSAYDAASSEAVYTEVRRQAELALGAGYSVVIDAVHQRPPERTALRSLAARLGLRFTGLWLEAAVDTLVTRVEGRVRDASDARADTVALQVRGDTGPIDWRRLDAGGDPREILVRAQEVLRAET